MSPQCSVEWVPPTDFTRKTTKYWVLPENLITVKSRIVKHLPVLVFGGAAATGGAASTGSARGGGGADGGMTAKQRPVRPRSGELGQSSNFSEEDLISSIYFDSEETNEVRALTLPTFLLTISRS